MEKKYKVTQKHLHCGMRCSFYVGQGHKLDCMNDCRESVEKEIFEETTEMTIEELIATINGGNCIITKVEEI